MPHTECVPGWPVPAGQRLAACSGTAAEFRLPSRWHPSPIGIPGAPAGILFCQEPVPLPEAGDHRLPQRQTAVVRGNEMVAQDRKAALLELFRNEMKEKSILKDAPR